ncbi:MAG TPA: LamG-like jellyroll fold domain-containing protein [Blastocatellia bacterium]|nr:LamG-like jellyroll fold domain-containing protein [Blastocatellia bacterium]
MKHALLFIICIFSLSSYAASDGPAENQQKNLPVLAHYRFDVDASDATGRNPDCQLRNAAFSDNALYLNGRYQLGRNPRGYRVVCSTPSLNYAAFTVAVRFKAQRFDWRRSHILAGGVLYRWVVINRTEDGNLNVILNNHRFRHEIKGARINKDEWTVVACGVDVASAKLVVYLNRVKVAEVDLPEGFRFEVEGSAHAKTDNVWALANYSNATIFHGLMDEMIIYDRMLSEEEFAEIPLHP